MSTPREPGGQTARNGETAEERLRTAIWQVEGMLRWCNSISELLYTKSSTPAVLRFVTSH